MGTLLQTNNLKAYYITNAYGISRTVKAVDDISITIREDEVYGIAGESGCGKSTLLKVLLSNLTPPLTHVGGSVTFFQGSEKKDLLNMPESELREMRWKEVSYLPQGSMFVLNPIRRI